MPAARAAWIPAGESSTAAHDAGGTPSRAAAARYGSGEGFDIGTSSAATMIGIDGQEAAALEDRSDFVLSAPEAIPSA